MTKMVFLREACSGNNEDFGLDCRHREAGTLLFPMFLDTVCAPKVPYQHADFCAASLCLPCQMDGAAQGHVPQA